MLHGKNKHLYYGQMQNLYLSTTVKPRELQEGDLKTCRRAKTSGQVMSQGEDSMPVDEQEMW